MARCEEAVVEADALGLGDASRAGTSAVSRPRPAKAPREHVDRRPRPGTSVGYCMARNSPACGPLPRRQAEQVDAVEGDRAAEHLVAGPAHDHVRQRRLARAVRAHHGVDLAAADGEVDALQDLLAGRRRRAGRSISETCSLTATTTSTSPSTTRASYTGTGLVAGSDSGSPVTSENALPCFQHSIMLVVAVDLALGSETSCVAAACRRWRRRRRRCGRARCGGRRRRPRGPCLGAGRRAAQTRSIAVIAQHRAVELGGDGGVAASGRRSLAPAGWSKHLVEEPGHDEPLGDLGRDAAALEVEALLLVDRADGRGVAAVHVVVLDLEVGHRLGPRARRTA